MNETQVTYGWDASWATEFESSANEGQVPGRVIRVDRDVVLVATEHGTVKCHVLSGVHRGGQGSPASGDWVAIRAGSGGGWVVDTILPRRSAISRMTAVGDDRQILAANVDVVFMVQGLERDLNLRRLERTLVMAWDSGATPVVVLTKTDLVATGPSGSAETVAAVKSVAPGVQVIAVSNMIGSGIDEVRAQIRPGATIVLIGESGAGKSSLVNQLLGDERQATSETREGDGKGRHTTSARELIVLPGGGLLIDTPGLRGLGLWEGSEGVARAFADLDDLAMSCRFRDCLHEAEPGCAVLGAVGAGDLEEDRLDSYRKLQREIVHESLRSDQRARRAEERESGRRFKRQLDGKEEW